MKPTELSGDHPGLLYGAGSTISSEDVSHLSQPGGAALPNRQAFTAAPTVRRYDLDSETILFNSFGGQVFVLNETAAFVWEALSHGLEIGQVADQIVLGSNADRDQVLADCRTLVNHWTDAGLSADQLAAPAKIDAGEQSPPNSMDSQHSNAVPLETLDSPTWRHINDSASEQRSYRIADLELLIEAPSEAFILLDGLLDHCASPQAAQPGDEQATLTLARDDKGWTLFLDGLLVTRCDDNSHLAPMIHATVLHLSYAASQSQLLIHGATVFSGERCVLLPGQPRAGKSTLTAALVASGLGFCTDDFSLLDQNPLRLRGIPLCIGLKEGSWPLFEQSIPAVAALPTHVREDGQQVRYLPPPVQRLAKPQDHFRVTAIVFPRLSENAACMLNPLPRSAALLQIAESGYHLMGELNADTVEATIEWLKTLDCYELHYWDLGDAVGEITQLLT